MISEKIVHQPIELSEKNEASESDLSRIKDQIEKRFDQSQASRLCEYVTGLPIESPELAQRLVDDHLAVRGKYGLPPREVRFDDPGWYEDFLHTLAKKENVEVVETSQCGSFFKVHPEASAVFMEDSARIGIDITRDAYEAYVDSMDKLEHETIHALQHKRTPGMPIEAREYEAYIAGGKAEMLRDVSMREMVFGNLIGASVAVNYGERSEYMQTEVVPRWSNAEYFLEQVDGLRVGELPEDAGLLFEKLKQNEAREVEERSSLTSF